MLRTMISIYPLLLTLMLFSELSSHLVIVAMPATETDDGLTDHDALSSLLMDGPMSETAVVPPLQRRSFLMDGIPKVIVSDERLSGHGVRGLNPAFARDVPQLKGRSLSHTPAEFSLKANRRDVDLDMLRCMIGRVYRPCWEV